MANLEPKTGRGKQDTPAIPLRSLFASGVLVISSWAIALWLYQILPERVPVHWNLQGEVDRYGSKFEGTMIVPIILTFLWLLFLFIPLLDPRRANYAKFRQVYLGLVWFLLGFLLLIQVLTGMAMMGQPIDIGVSISLAMALLFIVLGLILPRLKPNWFAGIRTPWTLEDDRVWEATHRLGGWLFILIGALAVPLIFISSPAALVVIVAGVLLVSLILVVYSLILYRRLHAQDPTAHP